MPRSEQRTAFLFLKNDEKATFWKDRIRGYMTDHQLGREQVTFLESLLTELTPEFFESPDLKERRIQEMLPYLFSGQEINELFLGNDAQGMESDVRIVGTGAEALIAHLGAYLAKHNDPLLAAQLHVVRNNPEQYEDVVVYEDPATLGTLNTDQQAIFINRCRWGRSPFDLGCYDVGGCARFPHYGTCVYTPIGDGCGCLPWWLPIR